MSITLAEQVAQWLKSKSCNCKNVRTVKVTIDAETWFGCHYEQEHTYTADMDCVRDGRHKAGEKYSNEMIYLVGRIPKVYGKAPRAGKSFVSRQQNVCFPFDNEEWYVAGYMQNRDVLTDEQKQFSPFGIYFMLAPWRVPGGEKIDKYEHKPYTRVPMSVEYV